MYFWVSDGVLHPHPSPGQRYHRAAPQSIVQSERQNRNVARPKSDPDIAKSQIRRTTKRLRDNKKKTENRNPGHRSPRGLGTALLGLVVATAVGLGVRLRVEPVDWLADAAEAPEDL